MAGPHVNLPSTDYKQHPPKLIDFKCNQNPLKQVIKLNTLWVAWPKHIPENPRTVWLVKKSSLIIQGDFCNLFLQK